MRLKAYIYDVATGLVRATIIGDKAIIKGNTREGEGVYTGDMDPSSQKIVNGKPQDMPKQPDNTTQAPDISYSAFLKAMADNKLSEFTKTVQEVLNRSPGRGK